MLCLTLKVGTMSPTSTRNKRKSCSVHRVAITLSYISAYSTRAAPTVTPCQQSETPYSSQSHFLFSFAESRFLFIKTNQTCLKRNLDVKETCLKRKRLQSQRFEFPRIQTSSTCRKRNLTGAEEFSVFFCSVMGRFYCITLAKHPTYFVHKLDNYKKDQLLDMKLTFLDNYMIMI